MSIFRWSLPTTGKGSETKKKKKKNYQRLINSKVSSTKKVTVLK